MRRAIPAAAAAFFVFAGTVLALFRASDMPPSYLTRPLAVSAALAVAVGMAMLVVGRYAVPAAAVVAAGISTASRWVVLAACVAAVGVVVGRIANRDVDLGRAVVAGSGVFLLAGVVGAVPLLGSPVSAEASVADDADAPTYLILLDGYPRADTLDGLGVDVAPFIDALEDRGFTHYPDARSKYRWTHHTLTALLGDTPQSADFGTVEDRRAAREAMRLPDGFAYIPPPIGHVTIPGANVIGTGGINNFEVDLIRRSLFGKSERVGGLVMDALRVRLDGQLETLASTDERRVFAHLLSPHTPFLYDKAGGPAPMVECWPRCNPFDLNVNRLGITVDEWADGTAGNLSWLNRRLVGVVDSIIARYPDATVVLFSDHGGRFSHDDYDEWHRTFLAARAGNRPPDVAIRLLSRSHSP